MSPMTALVRRELIEHRVAFIVAPAVLLAALTALLVFMFTLGDPRGAEFGSEVELPARLYEVAVAGIFGGWTAYLVIALAFYFADSFNADRKNNAMLFWKSMPQSDLRILSSKALAGATVFPALIIGFALVSGIIAYLLSMIVAVRLPVFATPGVGEALVGYLQMSVTGIVFMLVSVLWYAPLLAWIAGLSTQVGGWSIPLAIVIPAGATFLESVMYFGRDQAGPIASYLAYRLEGPFDEESAFEAYLRDVDITPLDLIPPMLVQTDWLQVLIGLVFTAVVVYLASEYRRRRIAA